MYLFNLAENTIVHIVHLSHYNIWKEKKNYSNLVGVHYYFRHT